MNSPQAHAWADGLAQRIASAGDVRQQITRAYQICFSRAPTADEIAQGSDFMKQGGALVDYCQVLLGLNEFVYAK